MIVAFWSFAAVIGWAYLGYPLFLGAVALIRRRAIRRAPIQPTVTIIVSAHNEEGAIRAKLENTLRLDYPRHRLEVIVAADGCTDKTGEIAQEFADDGVRVIELPQREGKTAAQNAAAASARGEILIFTDATTELEPDTVKGLVAWFAEPRVGCVSAALEYRSSRGSAVGKGGVTYWRYERLLKRLEAKANSLIGTSGCLYAVRASVYTPIDQDLVSDFVIASAVYQRGYLTVYAPNVVALEVTNESAEREFAMRVRVIVRSIHALVRSWRMLNPFRQGIFAIQLWSHKVLRYAVPECLIGALAANVWVVLAAPSGAMLYRMTLAGQLALYVAGALQWLWLRVSPGRRTFYLPFYFLHINLAALWALVTYVRGERMVKWTPIR